MHTSCWRSETLVEWCGTIASLAQACAEPAVHWRAIMAQFYRQNCTIWKFSSPLLLSDVQPQSFKLHQRKLLCQHGWWHQWIMFCSSICIQLSYFLTWWSSDIHPGSKAQNYQMWKMEVLGTQLSARQYPEAHIRTPSLPKVWENKHNSLEHTHNIGTIVQKENRGQNVTLCFKKDL